MDILVYLDTVLVFALGAFVASALAKASLAIKTAEETRAALPSEKRTVELAGMAAEAVVPAIVERLLESQKMKKQISRSVQDELSKGTVAAAMRSAIETQCKEIVRYLEKEIVPKVVNEESRKILVRVPGAA